MSTKNTSLGKILKHDKIHMARIKNRAENCRCETILSKLEKEKCLELRMVTNEKKKIINKYFKRTDSQRSSNSQISEKSCNFNELPAYLDYKCVHDLLFTNDEIDIEKIICLYLLCIHDTMVLTPPMKKKYKMTKENSPLERLIYRSKKKNKGNEGFLYALPLYILEYPHPNKPDILINDGRLASKVLFNEKIALLINTVMKALHVCNNDKFNKILEISLNERILFEILRSTKIRDYIQWIKSNPLITSCECFVLKSTQKLVPINLKIVTKTRTLENFLDDLHQNVLQLPTRRNYDAILDEVFNENFTTNYLLDESKKSFDVASVTSFTSKQSGKYTRRTVMSVLSDKLLRSSDGKFSNDSIMDLRKIFGKRDSSTSASKSSIEQKIEDLNFIYSEGSVADKSEATGAQIDEIGELKSEEAPIKFTLKQTRCEACMMKWKEPLPTPKTSLITRVSNLDSLRTNSFRRISSMINKELYHLKSYDTRYSKENGKLPRLSTKEDNKVPLVILNKNVNLSGIDLARIKQEIREKEAKKKLIKFLYSP